MIFIGINFWVVKSIHCVKGLALSKTLITQPWKGGIPNFNSRTIWRILSTPTPTIKKKIKINEAVPWLKKYFSLQDTLSAVILLIIKGTTLSIFISNTTHCKTKDSILKEKKTLSSKLIKYPHFIIRNLI